MIQSRSVLPFLQTRGLSYRPALLEAFLLSVRTRPFVILAGLSGTGKTALPRALGQYLTTGDLAPPISVNPDWQDNSDMMGYIDLNGDFRAGEFVEIVRMAVDDPGRVYIALLDEMNLAPVEQYFAQYLSVLESRYYDSASDRVLYADYCFNPAFRSRLRDAGAVPYVDLRIPDNVVVVGTVNVDESTTPFSRKVLDRANVLMFDEVDLGTGVPGVPAGSTIASGATLTQTTAAAGLPAHTMPPVIDVIGKITRLQDLILLWPRIAPKVAGEMEALLNEWMVELKKFAQPLETLRASFGLRVRDDVFTYLAFSSDLDSVDVSLANWWKPAFDQQLMQRIFPRIIAEQGTTEDSLVRLLQLCVGTAIPDTRAALQFDLDAATSEYPSSARHVQRLLRNITERDLPVAGFWS